MRSVFLGLCLSFLSASVFAAPADLERCRQMAGLRDANGARAVESIANNISSVEMNLGFVRAYASNPNMVVAFAGNASYNTAYAKEKTYSLGAYTRCVEAFVNQATGQ